MKNDPRSLARLTDEQVLQKVKALAALEREATAQLMASLAELDVRRLYLREGFSSLFSYCTEALHLSEHAAYNRIEVARAARRWPVILQMINDGTVTLTVVRLLVPSLTDDNHRQLLDAATHKSKREVEQMIAALHPQPPVPSIVRQLPTPNLVTPCASVLDCAEPATVATSVPPRGPQPGLAPVPLWRPALIAPLAPERFKVQMTVSRETHDKLRRVQDLLRHQVPDGDPAVVFDRALTLLLQDLERKKLADTRRPRPACASTPASRHVPAAVTARRSGSATRGNAHSSETREGAPSVASSNSITSFPLLTVARPRPTTFSFGAGRTTCTRRSGTSAPGSFEKSRSATTRSGTSGRLMLNNSRSGRGRPPLRQN